VGHAVAWVCVVQALPAFSTLVRRRPCGPLGGMGLRCAGLPRSLHLPFLYHSERDRLCEPRVRHGRMLMRPPPTSLNLKVSRRRDQVGLWGSMDALKCVLPPLLLLGLIAILVTQVSSDARGRQRAGPPLPALGI
jgi:hypothetical protein